MASRSRLARRETFSVFAGICFPPSNDVGGQLIGAGVAMYPTRSDVGVAFVDQTPQLLQLGHTLREELQARADDLVGAALIASRKLLLDDGIGLGAGCVCFRHLIILTRIADLCKARRAVRLLPARRLEPPSLMNQKFATLGSGGLIVSAEALDRGENGVGGLGPAERLGVGVVLSGERHDVGAQGHDAAVDAAPDLALGDEGEEA